MAGHRESGSRQKGHGPFVNGHALTGVKTAETLGLIDDQVEVTWELFRELLRGKGALFRLKLRRYTTLKRVEQDRDHWAADPKNQWTSGGQILLVFVLQAYEDCPALAAGLPGADQPLVLTSQQEFTDASRGVITFFKRYRAASIRSRPGAAPTPKQREEAAKLTRQYQLALEENPDQHKKVPSIGKWACPLIYGMDASKCWRRGRDK